MRSPVISASDAAEIARVSKLEWMTAAETAVHCRVGLTTFEKMVREIPIPFTRPAGPRGDRRFFRARVDAALMSRVENLPPAA